MEEMVDSEMEESMEVELLRKGMLDSSLLLRLVWVFSFRTRPFQTRSCNTAAAAVPVPVGAAAALAG